MTFPQVDIETIKRKREQLDISIAKMSELMGFESYQGYYKKESGLRQFSANDISKISKLLNLSYDEIFFEPKVTEKVIKQA